MNEYSNSKLYRQNYSITNEKLAFESDKNFISATINLHQQNSYMTSGIIFLTIPYCTIYYLLYQDSLLYVPIRKVLLDVLYYQLFLSLTVLTVPYYC